MNRPPLTNEERARQRNIDDKLGNLATLRDLDTAVRASLRQRGFNVPDLFGELTSDRVLTLMLECNPHLRPAKLAEIARRYTKYVAAGELNSAFRALRRGFLKTAAMAGAITLATDFAATHSHATH